MEPLLQAGGKANQAAPLTVVDLERLHSIHEGDGNNWDKLACGSFLFCVYARAIDGATSPTVNALPLIASHMEE